MKKLFIFALLLAVIVIIFIKSGAWEPYQTKVDRQGVFSYTQTRYRINMGNFFSYIKDIPGKLLSYLPTDK
ncbi:MAG: hypothetical protein ABH848_04385 [Candidatus Omnitrophota bacterium]